MPRTRSAALVLEARN